MCVSVTVSVVASRSSGLPATVTVCAVAQLAGVNTSGPVGARSTRSGASAAAIVTFPLGCDVSTTA